LNIRNHQEVLEYGIGVKVMRMRYDRWLQTVVVKILEEEILIPIWDAMKSHDYSQKIIDGTDIHQIVREGRKVIVKVRSDYMAEKPDGSTFDVARAREYGTVDHWIEPKSRNDPLGLQTDGPKALHWVTDWGEQAFSKGHVVGGIPARHLVEMIVNRNGPKVKERIKAEFEAWKKDIFNT
jgi:hypothetical protein